MPPPDPVEGKRKLFTIEDANKALPLVRAIVGDIVRQFRTVEELRQRLGAVLSERRSTASDPYSEELAQSQAEMASEEEKLASFVDELTKLGVELKGFDGLCDFPSVRDGRGVYLCWRLGEPEILYWHEQDAGFAGRQPLTTRAIPRAGQHSH